MILEDFVFSDTLCVVTDNGVAVLSLSGSCLPAEKHAVLKSRHFFALIRQGELQLEINGVVCRLAANHMLVRCNRGLFTSLISLKYYFCVIYLAINRLLS